MLKWAVNQPRPSYLAKNSAKTETETETGNGNGNGLGIEIGIGNIISSYSTPIPTPNPNRLKLKRNSLQLLPGKENQLTSTPLPATACSRTPLLRDLSNIMSPLQTPTPTSTTTPTPKPSCCRSQVKPMVYASTLPTFEAEYSPSYRPGDNNIIIPGPLLALRGMGIPDSYFEKPRYLEQKPLSNCAVAAGTGAAPVGQTTLSSSQMGDVTLERMIDAILESTRKATAPRGAGAGPTRTRTRAAPLRTRQRLRQREKERENRLVSTSPVYSPTYRSAFDPASDLCEYWQSNPIQAHAVQYEEREVRSPQPQPQPGSLSGGVPGQGKRYSLQLRRQRVVRRKRKIATKISSSVRQSAQKLLAAASRSAQKLPHSRSRSLSRSTQRHISPDSGHNTTSDCELEEELGLGQGLQLELGQGLGLGLYGEELEASCKLDAIWMQSEARDATKRRLSFSLTEDS